MADEGAPFQPGTEQITVPLRPRGTYAGYKAFGGGDGAVLVKPEVARELRSAAEFATRSGGSPAACSSAAAGPTARAPTWSSTASLRQDPERTAATWLSRDGTDNFALSGADLRLLREDAARMYCGPP